MKHNPDTNRHPRRRLARLLALAAVSITLIVVLISTTGGGSNTASLHAAQPRPTPAVQVAKTHGPAARATKVTAMKAATTPKPASQPPAPARTAKAASGIPQGNAGDGDPDNNGASSDGDGNI
ncbi:MAG: hypothetical protein ACTHQQ_15310 [Solirubrobacteraceae bacterium]